MSRRSVRHPMGSRRRFLGPVHSRPARSMRRPRRAPRMRPRRSVNVGALVASPQEVPSRPNVRVAVIGLLFLALFATMVLRLWSLQIIGQKSATAAVNQNQVRTVPAPAARGQILDRNGVVLVGNQNEQQIVLSRYEARVNPSIIAKVAALVGQTPAQVNKALKDSQFSQYQPVPVLTGAPMATIQYLDDHQAEFPGVSVQQASVRTYPEGGTCGCTATHVLGYVGPISQAELKENPGLGYQPSSQVGQSGLEHQYEQDLRGVSGQDELVVNAQNQVVGTLHKSQPKEGDILVTNVDTNLQLAVQAALTSLIQADRNTTDPTTHLYPAATDAAAIVEDVNSGAILALASSPTYNLNDWVGGISQANYQALSQGCTAAVSGCPLDNYAIQGLYTPGSTFKLVTATAALKDGLISAGQYIDDTGTFNVPGCNTSGGAAAGCAFHDDEAQGAGGVNVTTALTLSDDFYFYELGDMFYNQASRYGATPIQSMADDYGLDQVTGIDLSGEVQGRVDSQAERQLLHKEAPAGFPNTTWYAGDNIEMGFGQGGTVVTPIGLANAYATFANGGTRYKPEIGSALVDPETDKVVKRIKPQATGHIGFTPAVYDPILQGLEGVVEGNGTAGPTFKTYAHFDLSNYRIAGKTGTADTAPKNIVKGTDEPNAWFVAFGPIPNPQYVVAVVVDHGGYGAQAAAPAVMNIFNYLVTNPIGPLKLPSPTSPPTTTVKPFNPPAGTPTPTTAPRSTTGG
ncbi:MAG: penicillin-binding protein 2 [Acidimicrobiales bacterium]